LLESAPRNLKRKALSKSKSKKSLISLKVCTAISLVDLGKPADIVFKDSPLTAYLFGWTYMLCHLIPIPIMFVVSIIRNLRAGQVRIFFPAFHKRMLTDLLTDALCVFVFYLFI
jgi:hypothetical protein